MKSLHRMVAKRKDQSIDIRRMQTCRKGSYSTNDKFFRTKHFRRCHRKNIRCWRRWCWCTDHKRFYDVCESERNSDNRGYETMKIPARVIDNFSNGSLELSSNVGLEPSINRIRAMNNYLWLTGLD